MGNNRTQAGESSMGDETLNVTIPFIPNMPQNHFLRGMKRFNIFECHRGAGKTYMALMLLISRSLSSKYPNANFALLSPEAKQGEQNIEQMFLEICKPLGQYVEYHKSKGIFEFANGSKVYLLGVKNSKALRGKRWDGVILDEFAIMESADEMWHDVLLPSLERWDSPDRKGWVLITTTPPQKEHFYRKLYSMAKERTDEWYIEQFPITRTGLYNDTEIQSIKSRMTPTSFAIEYMCSHNIPSEGAYFGECLVMAEEQGRIKPLPFAHEKGVYASFDIGKDGTAIWFAQIVDNKWHFIDYFEEQKQARDVSFYANVLKSKPYRYNRIWLPHDGTKTHIGMPKSFYEQFKAFYGAETVRLLQREFIDESIFRAIGGFYNCWFDGNKCRKGIQALREYSPKIDKNGVVTNSIDHNWASHGADSFRYMMNGLSTANTKVKEERIANFIQEKVTVGLLDFDPF
jgi:phage terminase large subunit